MKKSVYFLLLVLLAAAAMSHQPPTSEEDSVSLGDSSSSSSRNSRASSGDCSNNNSKQKKSHNKCKGLQLNTRVRVKGVPQTFLSPTNVIDAFASEWNKELREFYTPTTPAAGERRHRGILPLRQEVNEIKHSSDKELARRATEISYEPKSSMMPFAHKKKMQTMAGKVIKYLNKQHIPIPAKLYKPYYRKKTAAVVAAPPSVLPPSSSASLRLPPPTTTTIVVLKPKVKKRNMPDVLSSKALLKESQRLNDAKARESQRALQMKQELKHQKQVMKDLQNSINREKAHLKKAKKKQKEMKMDGKAMGPRGRNYIPKKGSMLAASLRKAPIAYTYMFWIYLKRIHKKWAQVLHKGDGKRVRCPAIWFIPKTTKLHVRSATKGKWNTGLNTSKGIGVKKWTHVTVIHKPGKLKVFFNGRLVTWRKLPKPVQNNAPLYSTAPFYGPCNCEMNDIRYLPKEASHDYIMSRVRRKKYYPVRQ